MPRPLMVLVTVSWLTGCAGNTTPTSGGPVTTRKIAQTPAAGPFTRPTEVSLNAVTVADYEADIRSKFAGHVVAVDVWFLGCAPCVKKFPEMVALSEKLAKDGVVVASLNIMPDEVEVKDKVLAFLEEKHATMPNYLFADTQDAADAWTDRESVRVTPAVVLYDRSGTRVKTLVSPKTEEVEAEVAKLLAGA